MKKITLSLLALSTIYSSSSLAQEKYSGFSYAGFGVETATYQETYIDSDGVAYKTSATTSSPVYTSGSLINVSKSLDFSIDATSTLSPTQTKEQTQNTTTSVIVQENQYDSVQSDLRFLLHYKVNNNHRFVFGPEYNQFTMKRYNFVYPGTDDTIPNTHLNQEDIATLFMMAGYWYESRPFSSNGLRVSFSALYGTPVYNSATNTGIKDIEFSSTDGSMVNINGYIGFELTKGLELGIFGNYALKNKNDESTEETDTDGTIVWPENELETFRYGISFVWNFDVK